MSGLVLDKATVLHFVFLTLALGGGAGWLTGRAIATTWRPYWMLVPAAIALGLAVRFVHFALFDEPLASIPLIGVDSTVVGLFMAVGYSVTRTRQMNRQYGFLRRL